MWMIILAVWCAVNLIAFIHSNHSGPSDTFIDIVDEIYSSDEVTVLDTSHRDVTEEFIEKYQEDYDSGDYETIYEDTADDYTFDLGDGLKADAN
ncbi:MAG: hypothetical protein ACI4WR_10100 [Bulleidia sp.]